MRTASVALVLSILAFAPSGFGQEPAAAKKDSDPAVVAKIKEIQTAILDPKASKDDAAINQIKQVFEQRETLGAKDRDAFVAVLGDVFFKAKARTPDKSAIYVTSAKALEYFGNKGAKVLVKAYDDEKFSKADWLDLRSKLLVGIGKTKDEAQVHFLIDRVVRTTDDPLIRAAGEAVGYFEASPGKIRWDICKEMIKRYNEIFNASRSTVDPSNVAAKTGRERIAAIADTWNTSLSKLTRQADIREADKWLHWWNKNKDSDWNKLK